MDYIVVIGDRGTGKSTLVDAIRLWFSTTDTDVIVIDGPVTSQALNQIPDETVVIFDVVMPPRTDRKMSVINISGR